MISNKTYILLYLLLVIAVAFGMFLPLMENDSAQHATMAMQMAKSNDFLTILKGGHAYLDKPHMHFWLAALSFELFGFEVWAYRLPAILLTFLSGYATFKLAFLLYQSKNISKLSALMFLTTQAILLSIHDVRTDAVLTSFTVLAAWQWTRFLKQNAISGAIWGGLFTAFAYSTKGIIAIAIIGAFLFFMVLYQNYWKRLLNYKLPIGILTFVVGSLPMLYAYDHQFGTEGVEFITYGQATGRFSGEDFGGASKNDYAFYFHTILWAFLPWSLWFYYGIFLKGKSVVKKEKLVEISTVATILLFVIAMNFSQFKLPHYLNIVLPFAAIFTSAIAIENFKKVRTNIPKWFQSTQYIMAILGLLLLGFLALVAFPLGEIPVIFVLLAAIILLIFLFIKSKTRLERTVVVSAGFILLTNIYLNSTFYPQLLQYQSGYALGEKAKSLNIPPENLYATGDYHSWSVDWMMHKTIQKADKQELTQLHKPHWVLIYNTNPHEFAGSRFKINKSYRADHYRITRLTWDFINPLSRPETLKDVWLVEYVLKD